MADPSYMNAVKWLLVESTPSQTGMPYATHTGVLELLGVHLRCYRLNTGEAILHADDVHALFAAMRADHG